MHIDTALHFEELFKAGDRGGGAAGRAITCDGNTMLGTEKACDKCKTAIGRIRPAMQFQCWMSSQTNMLDEHTNIHAQDVASKLNTPATCRM